MSEFPASASATSTARRLRNIPAFQPDTLRRILTGGCLGIANFQRTECRTTRTTTSTSGGCGRDVKSSWRKPTTGATRGPGSRQDGEAPGGKDAADVNAATAAIPVTAHPAAPADRGRPRSLPGHRRLRGANDSSHNGPRIAAVPGNRSAGVEVDRRSVVTRRQVN